MNVPLATSASGPVPNWRVIPTSAMVYSQCPLAKGTPIRSFGGAGGRPAGNRDPASRRGTPLANASGVAAATASVTPMPAAVKARRVRRFDPAGLGGAAGAAADVAAAGGGVGAAGAGRGA